MITIDGLSGSGKGTITRLLSEKLGWNLLNSGILYRALALAAKKRNLSLDNEVELSKLAKNLNIKFVSSSVFLDGENIQAVLASETLGNEASQVAIFPAVRQALIETQRSFRQPPGLVAEGRDMGTVIFPDADVKIFLEASVEERAKRRYQQLLKQGFDVRLPDLIFEVTHRDLREQTRKTAPTKIADDATVVDTTSLTVEQVFNKILNMVSNGSLGYLLSRVY